MIFCVYKFSLLFYKCAVSLMKAIAPIVGFILAIALAYMVLM